MNKIKEAKKMWRNGYSHGEIKRKLKLSDVHEFAITCYDANKADLQEIHKNITGKETAIIMKKKGKNYVG